MSAASWTENTWGSAATRAATWQKMADKLIELVSLSDSVSP